MKKLLIYLKHYKKETILAPLFKLLEATLELLIPLVMAAIIDTGIANSDKGFIVRYGVLMVSLGVIGLAFSITAQYFSAKAAVGFATELKHALFAHIQGLSFTEMDTIGTPTLIQRMTGDVNQVQSGVNLVLRLFLRSPFVVFGAMVMAFTIDFRAALIFVVTIPVLSLVVFGILLASMPLYKKVQEGTDKVLGVTRENLTGIRVIRAFNKEASEREAFESSNETLASLQKFVGKISALMNPLTYIVINGAIIVLIWTGAIRVDIGILTQGAVVALVSYMSQILTELIKLANLIITISKSIACGNRIQSIFEIKTSLYDGQSASGERREAVVSFEDVSLRYKNAGEDAVKNISFTARRGETIGIIGGTGSGKSSVVNLIPRFYDVTGGSLKVDGVDVRDYKLDDLRGKIGMVMQKAVLFKGTIRENLLWGKKDATDEEIQEALRISQAREFVDAKEDGLDSPVAQGGKNLSGGQKQRLTIARALLRKPDILILDDSASALDFATDAKLRKAIKEMADSPTVFIVSQRASSIQYADQIIVLDDGEMAGRGTHEQLLETCEVYQEIYYSQFEREEARG